MKHLNIIPLHLTPALSLLLNFCICFFVWSPPNAMAPLDGGKTKGAT